MDDIDIRAVSELVMIAKDAGIDYLRVGNVEIRFAPPAKEPTPTIVVPLAQRGKVVAGVDGEPVEEPSNYHKLFGERVPTFSGPRG